MPTQSELGQEQGFRSSLFGFDKNDVLAYMNALAVETNQREEQYREQLQARQAQVEKLQGEQAAARQCVEKLQTELQQARQLQEAAEQRARQAEDKQAEAEHAAAEKEERWKAAQQALVELRFRCKELEEQSAAAPQAAEAAGAPSAASDARIEARKILADARLYAENAERRMQQQAQEQKERMADHARGIAAGVLLLRSRLGRVDEKISAATLDMENATAAIYQALDEVDADLDALGARLEKFDPDDPVPSAPPTAPFSAQQVFETPAAPRQRVTAQAVPQRRARPVRQAARVGTRLRRSARSVAENLQKALDRFEDE